MKKAILALADGTVFEGTGLGAEGEALGELIFTTGMTGYLETLTDPTCCGQLVVMTYPIIGNYGVNREDAQSDRPQAGGLIVKEAAAHPHNFRCRETLEEYLKSEGVVAIAGLDTRALTKILRTKGSMNGLITTDETFDFEAREAEIKAYHLQNAVGRVTCREKYVLGDGPVPVAVLDYGVRRNLLEGLLSRGARVTVYPADTRAAEILAERPRGIVLSNGPGDPRDCSRQIREIQELLQSKTPIFGIGLGHQLTALAMGGETEKLKFGHRGANQPVRDLRSGRIFITEQAHGFAVKADSLSKETARLTHCNLNDGTVEGIQYIKVPAFTVQFCPEVTSVPAQTENFFEAFFTMMEGRCHA